MNSIIVLLGVLLLAGCGEFHPATPGHEPPSAGNYNPVSHERTGGNN